MDNLFDVFGYFADYGDYFHKEDQWLGTVIVNDNNKFEGFAESYYGDEKFFLFGKIKDDQISVVRCPINEDERLLDRYVGKKKGHRFYGTRFENNHYSEIPVGECKVSLQPVEMTRDMKEEDVQNLRDKISLAKLCIEDTARAIYDSFMDNHEEMMKTAKKIAHSK